LTDGDEVMTEKVVGFFWEKWVAPSVATPVDTNPSDATGCNFKMPFNVALSFSECLEMPVCKVKLSLGNGNSLCQMPLLILLFVYYYTIS